MLHSRKGINHSRLGHGLPSIAAPRHLHHRLALVDPGQHYNNNPRPIQQQRPHPHYTCTTTGPTRTLSYNRRTHYTDTDTNSYRFSSTRQRTAIWKKHSCLAVTRTCVHNCVVPNIEAPPPASAQDGLAAVHLHRHQRIRSSSRHAERTTCNRATTITASAYSCRRMTWNIHAQALAHGTRQSRRPNCTIIGVDRRRGSARTVRRWCSCARCQLPSVTTARIV